MHGSGFRLRAPEQLSEAKASNGPAKRFNLAGVTGFEPAQTRFGDERPSRRVITPVAVATGVEPVPPDRQSGILPLDSATTF